MAGIFPESGAPAGPNAPGSQTGVITNSPTTCPPLFHQGVCIPRFDPASANAVISEIANAVNDADLPYSCETLHNLSLAIQYTVQRGEPRGIYGTLQSPTAYTGTMNPPSTGFVNYQVLTFVPNVNNPGPVTLNGVQILRNDGLPPQAGDLRANVPMELAYWNGNLYIIGVSPSQVPQVMTSSQTYWVRTDGNDANDGSANTPQAAFATLQGAWNAVGSRYFPSPFYSITLMLGNPGVHTGGLTIADYGGRVNVVGGGAANYIVTRPNSPTPYPSSVISASNANIAIEGVTVSVTDTAGGPASGISSGGSYVYLKNISIVSNAPAVLGPMIVDYRGSTYVTEGSVILNPQGMTSIAGLVTLVAAGAFQVAPDSATSSTLNFQNVNAATTLISISDQSLFGISGPAGNVTGTGVSASAPSSANVMSIVRLAGVTMPGAGFTVDSSSILIP